MTFTVPPLVASRRLRFSALTALYAVQGLPYGLLIAALPAYMAEQGLSPREIGGFVAVSMLPWSLKLINGALMDRWSYPAMGRRRPWVIASQAGLVAAFGLMALLPDPMANLALLGALGFLINLFTTFQDVATDGMAIDVVPVEEQARANGFMYGGKTLGIAAATGGGTWMLNAEGFQVTMFVIGALAGLGLAVPLLIRERSGERLLPWTQGKASEVAAHPHVRGWRDVAHALLRAVTLPGSVAAIAAYFAYSVSSGLMQGALPVMTVQKLGWQDTAFAELSAAARLLAGALSITVGGILVERMGSLRAAVAGSSLIFGGSIAMGLFPALLVSESSVRALVVGYTIVDAVFAVAIFATAMGLCWKRVAATQFALYMAVGNLGVAAGASMLGFLVTGNGYAPVMFAVGGACLLTVALLRLVDLEQHGFRLRMLDGAAVIAAPLKHGRALRT